MNSSESYTSLDLAAWALSPADHAIVDLMISSAKVSAEEVATLLDLWSMEVITGTDFVTYLEEQRVLRAPIAKSLRETPDSALAGVRVEAAISLVALKVKLRVCQIQSHRNVDSTNAGSTIAPPTTRHDASSQLRTSGRESKLKIVKAGDRIAAKAAKPAPAAKPEPVAPLASLVPVTPPPAPSTADAESEPKAETDRLRLRLGKLPVTACACPGCHHIVPVTGTRTGEPLLCPSCHDYIVVPANAFAPGSVVQGDYIVRKRLGLGANGIVYGAMQISLRREIALKVLLPAGDDSLESFHTECRTLARLQHGNIVQAYNASEIEGCGLLAMEFVRGSSLADRLETGVPFDIPGAMAIAGQLADALEYAWEEAQVVHRDIKPGNILMDDRDRPKLADFGLALSCGSVQTEDDDKILGTPAYMAPENIIGETLDFRADMYSLGIIIYQMVTAVHPFADAKTPRDMLQHHLRAHVVEPSAHNPYISPRLDALILRLLAKDPDARHESYDELIQDLRDCLIAAAKNSPGAATSRATRRIFAQY